MDLHFIDMTLRKRYEYRFDGLWKSEKYPGSICKIVRNFLYWQGDAVAENDRKAGIYTDGLDIKVYGISGRLESSGNGICFEDGDRWVRVHPFTPSGSGSGSGGTGGIGVTLSSSTVLTEVSSPVSSSEINERA